MPQIELVTLEWFPRINVTDAEIEGTDREEERR